MPLTIFVNIAGILATSCARWPSADDFGCGLNGPLSSGHALEQGSGGRKLIAELGQEVVGDAHLGPRSTILPQGCRSGVTR